MHRLLESAIAPSERVVQPADSLSHTLRAVKRAVVHLCVLCAGTTYHQKLRRRAARELDEREVTYVALHRHVETRAELLDQAQLLQQRRKLAWRVVPFDARPFPAHPCPLPLPNPPAHVPDP